MMATTPAKTIENPHLAARLSAAPVKRTGVLDGVAVVQLPRPDLQALEGAVGVVVFRGGIVVEPTVTSGVVVLSASQLHLVVVTRVVWTLVVVLGGTVVVVGGRVVELVTMEVFGWIEVGVIEVEVQEVVVV